MIPTARATTASTSCVSDVYDDVITEMPRRRSQLMCSKSHNKKQTGKLQNINLLCKLIISYFQHT